MKRVLLFGGTFDPPHNGHMNNLRAAVAAVKPDLVIVMPAGIPPHKRADPAPGPLRLAMCECFRAAVGDTPLEVSAWELERPGRSYTIHTVEMLKKRFPGAHLYLCMGSDMLLTFPQWREWRRLVRLATLVVESREENDGPALRAAAAALRKAGGHVVFAKAPAVPCASSALREGGIDPQEAKAFLPPPVPELIEKYGLYKTEK